MSGRWGRRPQSLVGPLDRGMMCYNFGAGRFHTKKLCSRLFSTEGEICWKKIAKSRFVPPFEGLMGNVHGLSMAHWKARGRLPISAN